mmetsp:Transcript_420/g.966  ORF Transcript_420/g.966 Transcript_420/m.966 type:complete len:206 (-) Transcript_420:183-800(-)
MTIVKCSNDLLISPVSRRWPRAVRPAPTEVDRVSREPCTTGYRPEKSPTIVRFSRSLPAKSTRFNRLRSAVPASWSFCNTETVNTKCDLLLLWFMSVRAVSRRCILCISAAMASSGLCTGRQVASRHRKRSPVSQPCTSCTSKTELLGVKRSLTRSLYISSADTSTDQSTRTESAAKIALIARGATPWPSPCASPTIVCVFPEAV